MIMGQLKTCRLVPQEGHLRRWIIGYVLGFDISEKVDGELPLLKMKIGNQLHAEDVGVELERGGDVLDA